MQQTCKMSDVFLQVLFHSSVYLIFRLLLKNRIMIILMANSKENYLRMLILFLPYLDCRFFHKNTFSQFLHIGCVSLLFILSLCFIFQPSSPPSNLDDDGAVIFDKPNSSNSFYIKRKDGKDYDLYIKQEDSFINAGIIENPEDYKGSKIYSNKKEAMKIYENIE